MIRKIPKRTGARSTSRTRSCVHRRRRPGRWQARHRLDQRPHRRVEVGRIYKARSCASCPSALRRVLPTRTAGAHPSSRDHGSSGWRRSPRRRRDVVKRSRSTARAVSPEPAGAIDEHDSQGERSRERSTRKHGHCLAQPPRAKRRRIVWGGTAVSKRRHAADAVSPDTTNNG